MKIIGKVEFIINDQYLLISSEEDLSRDQIVIVYTILENEEINKKYNLNSLPIPKGEIAIVMEESEGLYLAEIFQMPEEKKKIISHPSSFDKLVAGGLRSLLEIKKEEIIEMTPGKRSGILDKKVSLNFEYNKEITIGDIVGLP